MQQLYSNAALVCMCVCLPCMHGVVRLGCRVGGRCGACTASACSGWLGQNPVERSQERPRIVGGKRRPRTAGSSSTGGGCTATEKCARSILPPRRRRRCSGAGFCKSFSASTSYGIFCRCSLSSKLYDQTLSWIIKSNLGRVDLISEFLKRTDKDLTHKIKSAILAPKYAFLCEKFKSS